MRKHAIFLCAAALALFLSAISFAQLPADKTAPDEKEQTLGIVLDLERPSDTDVLLLRNGDKLTGTILNESFIIRTSYCRLKFNNRTVAGIDLEGGANNIEAIVTVNNNRFSGFINDPAFVFKLQTGPQIQVRREKVLKAVFRVRDAERKGIPQRRFLVLKNGDYFSGKILNDKLTVATTYARVPLNLEDADSITLIGGRTPLTKILMRNKDTLQGVLETEDIHVELDIGGEIKIYKDRINVIYCIEGFIPTNIDQTSVSALSTPHYSSSPLKQILLSLSATGSKIKVGGLFSATGPDPHPELATKIASYLKNINSLGGINGRKIKYTWFDYGGRVEEMVTKTKLLKRIGCSLIIYNCDISYRKEIEQSIFKGLVRTYYVEDNWSPK